MSEPIPLWRIIKEIMTTFERRRELEIKVKEGEASEGDHLGLEAINRSLQQ